jgi:DNA-binding CsgD family transcriptional regulator
MAELTLSDTQQFALRALLGAEPIEGEPLPKTTVLDQIARLIPCDAIGAALGGNDGWARAEVTLPRGYADSYGATCDGPWYLGVQTWAHIPEESEGLAAGGLVDTLTAGFRTGRDEVAQVWLDRRTREFSRQDLDMLSLIAPALQRLVRASTTQRLPASLTLGERRVLQHLALGLSNEQIAARLFVAPSTVRKHLENAYRKLGVTNRLAAVTRCRGESVGDPDLRELIDRCG